MRAWLEDPARHKVGQNLKYDAHVFENHGVRLKGIEHDTLLESYVLEAHRSHDMDSLARRHLERTTITYDEVTGKGASRIPFDQVGIEQASRYAAEDADVTMHLHRVLYPQVAADPRLDYVYATIEIPACRVLQRMERHGVLVDGALLARQSEELGHRMLEIEARAYEVAGQPFNLNSPKQLGEILFQRLGLPVVKKTATGAPSTDEERCWRSWPRTIRCRAWCSTTAPWRSSSPPIPTSCRRWSTRAPAGCTPATRRRWR
jgi:DNA polymerase-1